MNDLIQNLQQGLQVKLQEINAHEASALKKAERSLQSVLATLEQLKLFIISYRFKSAAEEIHFFKEIKPQFVCKQIYYLRLINIQLNQPTGSYKTIKKYLHHQLNTLSYYFINNRSFYHYYRTGSEYLDNQYFLRGKPEMLLTLNAFFFAIDDRFSTSHDYKVAKILANDMLLGYLNNELARLEKPVTVHPKAGQASRSGLKWTASKTDLTELIYALFAVGCINNSNIDIKKIAGVFESIFNIELGDYYRTYLEIRLRKTNRTKLLDALKQKLVNKMDEDDER